jgi:biuret amidohydrolase
MADELAALVVVDMQIYQVRRSVITEMQSGEGGAPYYLSQVEKVVEPNILKLLAVFRQRGAPVAFTRLAAQRDDASDLPPTLRDQNRAAIERFGTPLIPHKESPESELVSSMNPGSDELVLLKSTSGSFIRSPLEGWLRSRGASRVVLAGVFTNLCVESTARTAFDLGFRVDVVEDACAALSPELHASALVSLGLIYARITRTEEVVAMLRT